MKIFFLLLFMAFNLSAQEVAAPAIPSGATEKINGLFLYTKINLSNFNWKDLSVEGEESFVNPLNQNWIEWFKQNQTNFTVVDGCVNQCEQEFNQWLEGINLEKRSGVWVKTDLNLRRLEDERFEISGGIVFLDIESHKDLGAKTIELQKITFPILDLKKRNSALASYLFRSTLSYYSPLITSMSSEKDFRSVRLVIKGFSSLSDIQALEKLITEKNTTISLKTSLVGFARQEAQLNVTFKGEEKLFTDLLSGLKELKSTRRFTLVHELIENDHVLKMIAE